jgi:hypothetical protein
MGAFATPSQLSPACGVPKVATFRVAGPASYDTGGSVIDLSTATLGVGVGFTRIDNVSVNSEVIAYGAKYLRAASGAAATGKIVVYDAGAADGGDQVTNATDLSAGFFNITVTGL